MKDELVIKEEPLSAGDDMTHNALQADLTSTSSKQSQSSAIQDESVSSVRGQSSEKPHACDICDFRTGRLSHLKRHMVTHTSEKPYSCDVCDYRTGDLSHLKAHLRTHTGEKPHACDLCDFRSVRPSHLKRHIMTHSSEKPYSCDVCDFRTVRHSNLKRHMATHAGEKPHKPHACDVCDYRTGTHSDLKKHLRTHTGEKPFACDICDYRTGHHSHLKTHVRTHTGEKPYNCDVCDYRTRCLSNLKRHIKKHADGGPPVITEEEVVIREVAITVDHGMITGDNHGDMGSPSSFLTSTHQPEVRDEADILHECVLTMLHLQSQSIQTEVDLCTPCTSPSYADDIISCLPTPLIISEVDTPSKYDGSINLHDSPTPSTSRQSIPWPATPSPSVVNNDQLMSATNPLIPQPDGIGMVVPPVSHNPTIKDLWTHEDDVEFVWEESVLTSIQNVETMHYSVVFQRTVNVFNCICIRFAIITDEFMDLPTIFVYEQMCKRVNSFTRAPRQKRVWQMLLTVMTSNNDGIIRLVTFGNKLFKMLKPEVLHEWVMVLAAIEQKYRIPH